MSFMSSGTYPSDGQRVRVTNLTSTDGLLIEKKHLNVRRSGEEGTVKGFVPGHGGDVWWVEHDNGDVAAYGIDEMEPA